ncbi:nicotinate phosphoribosyltransferase [Devriesea agamarum]|uniref:nicotinate phosphoribosyltransferase n=1 Tax=Devriesea agamarum TaxID=472569 RepID=UPI000AACFBF5|nr:nicotinate phosphoribosyltransferase [Devriesea agamarum]
MTTSLFTDHYELTMVQAARRAGTDQRRCVFEVFTRRLPEGRRYGVLAGTGRFLEALKEFRFNDAELKFLRDRGIVDSPTLQALESYRFGGHIYGYEEGELFFPHSPVLRVEGTFADAVVLETLLLSMLNYDSSVASVGSRMTWAAGERPCIEMGSRRVHEEAGVAAARAAAIAGFSSTSNLEAGRRYGIPTGGTAAHAFTLLFDSEADAFTAQVESLGRSTTLLVDTYDVMAAVRKAVEIAGPQLGAVRLDSGNLQRTAQEVRDLLDSLGAHATRIVATSDLDEFKIVQFGSAPIDVFGIGTNLVTGGGYPAAGFVYKLVEHEAPDGTMIPVAKKSAEKTGTGGRKLAVRVQHSAGDSHRAVCEAVIAGKQHLLDDYARRLTGRALQVPLVLDGEMTSSATPAERVQQARQRHAESLAELNLDGSLGTIGSTMDSVGSMSTATGQSDTRTQADRDSKAPLYQRAGREAMEHALNAGPAIPTVMLDHERLTFQEC